MPSKPAAPRKAGFLQKPDPSLLNPHNSKTKDQSIYPQYRGYAQGPCNGPGKWGTPYSKAVKSVDQGLGSGRLHRKWGEEGGSSSN